MIIQISFFLCCQLEYSYSQFNLYNTEESFMMNPFDHDCLYVDQSDEFDDRRRLVPFCLRPETQRESNNDGKFCYGNKITFKELKLINASIADLFKWNAVIETIDLYEKYLLSSNPFDEDKSYCNCSLLSQFGKSCEYKFNDYYPYDDDERSFTQLFNERDYLINDEIQDQYMTYYVGIQCQTILRYLDWRQICNGIIDCDNGEDEPFELCLQMESNQCNIKTEFRCKNGFCIPKSLGYDLEQDCLDRSDVTFMNGKEIIAYFLGVCAMSTAIECDETNLGWKKFSCGDGQVIFYSDVTSKKPIDGKTCSNGRNFKYLIDLFSSKHNNPCWKSMICLTGFDYLYPNINCSNETIEISIEKYCLNEFYFPPNSVVYSFVYFLYEKANRTNWFLYTGPNYVCYRKEYCEKYISNVSTVLKNNLTCFHVNQTLFSWENFLEYVIYAFSSCYSYHDTSPMVNSKLFYKCNLSNTSISIHRVLDKSKDCFFNEDESPNISLCHFNTNDHFQCLTNQSECVRESLLGDGEYDCLDGSDEYFSSRVRFCFHDICSMYSKTKNHAQIYRFEELCDNIVNPHLFHIKSSETDETDCEHWPLKCDKSPYTKCNNVWNCENGIDENECSFTSLKDTIHSAFPCMNHEHYCIKLINNNTDISLSCISFNRTGDGVIDCVGGTDERLNNICMQKYLKNWGKRFHCMNSSICIDPNQVCDRIVDCPFEDDERVCPWLFNSNSSKFYCQNSPSRSIDRCDSWAEDDPSCQLKEQLWFCDLKSKIMNLFSQMLIKFEEYPKNDQYARSMSFEYINSNTLLLASEEKPLTLNTNTFSCNKGYPIQSLMLKDKFNCLCPPSYYGDHCQFQSERLTVLIQVQLQYDINPFIVFRFILYLLNANNTIISHDEVMYNRQFNNDDELRKFFVYLIYERSINLSLYQRSKSKFVRIDSYIIKETNVEYISSWLFHVSFSFLPVNRIVAILKLEDESFKIYNCKKKCGSHGKCMYYLNLPDQEYCWCDQGWYGENCHLKSLFGLCNTTSCAPHAQCFIINDEKQQIKCICPLGKFGNQCYAKHNPCQNIFCQNNGTCLSLDPRNIIGYTCICRNGSSGDHCEKLTSTSYISIPSNISDSLSIPVIMVILSGPLASLFEARGRYMYKNIPLPNTLQLYVLSRMKMAFIRVFHSMHQDFYYLIAIQNADTIRSINTTVISENLCPNINQILNSTIINEYSYLKRLKLYHLPCQENNNLRCFFDEYRMCLCTQDHFSDCFLFHHNYHDCDYCKNNGLCLRENDLGKQWNFVCLCPKCFFGRRCQFESGNYLITFDLLVGVDIQKDLSFDQQPFLVYFTLLIVLLILITGFILNTIGIIIFSNNKLRQVGCDLYLLYLTIISQIGLVLLFLRFLYVVIIQIYTIEDYLFSKIGCIFLEYSLRLTPSIFDWFTVCISIERTYTVIKDVQFTKLLASKTLKLSRWIILCVLSLNILTTLHRPFYLQLIDDDAQSLTNRRPGHPWCILDFQSTSWNIYEKFINVIHLTIPLLLNLSSTMLFLLRKTVFELRTTVRNVETSAFGNLKQQLKKYKPLLISTTVIFSLEIPRFALTFALACIEYPWQRYMYLTGYLISFLPLTGIVFIYILPSPKYNQELQTILKKIFCRHQLLQ